ncbi:MAG: hypothetical protein JSV98_05630 [candidate division WOR-3 bacterium]|nr:MAG: hypothetical protein JSV98_05630 [candidate division WOR-3 bacterium]
MDIIEKLKKEKKVRSVFEVILKGKEAQAAPEEKLADIEVRELDPASPAGAADSEPTRDDAVEEGEGPLREFRTEGMHEFDMESLSASGEGALRVEYKARVGKLIDERRVDEAIEMLKELKSKLENIEK